MNRLSHWVSSYSRVIIGIVLVITVVFAYFAIKIDIKAGIKEMFPEQDQAVQTYDHVEALFGGIVYVVMMIEDDQILDQPTLTLVNELSCRFSQIVGVDGVTSLATIKNIRNDDFGIEITNFMENVPQNEAEILRLKEDLQASDNYLGSVISEDFKSTVILVKINTRDSQAESILAEMEEIAGSYQGTERYYITGPTVLASIATDYIKKDLTKLLPFIIGIIILILWLTFRSLRGVVLPLITVLISVIWTVGLLSMIGKSLSMISTVLPVLLVSVGSAYAIHFIARYYEELNHGFGVEQSLDNTIKHVGAAVIMAGGTTIAGFSSLITSPLRIIKEFGLATAFGVGVALIVAITFVPAVLLNLSPPRKLRLTENSWLNKLFRRISQMISKYRLVIIGLAVLLAVASIIIMPQLKPETNYISYFKQNSSPRVAMEQVDQRFGGAMSLELVIYGDIKNPDLLSRMEIFQQKVEELERVNQCISMVDIFKEENKALHNGDQTMKVIPTTENQIAQYLLLLTLSDEQFIRDYLTFDYGATKIQIKISNASSNQLKQTIGEVKMLVDQYFGENYDIELTGVPVLMSEMMNRVVTSQINSLILSVICAFILTSLFLKSVKYGLFCSLPICLTILLNFGIMGWTGIPLDFATSMIASIAVGIGVDYSIHIFSRYLEEKVEHEDSHQALITAICTVGQANLYNALAVVAGFSVILCSSFSPLVNFGGLTATTMIVSFFGAVLILPAVIIWALQIQQKNKNL